MQLRPNGIDLFLKRAPDFPRCIVATFILIACGLPATAASEGSFQRTLRVTGAVTLDVSTGSGNIQIRTGSSAEVQVIGRIRITEWFSGNADDKIRRLENNPPIEQTGNDIRIGRIDDPELRRNVSISYELSCPPKLNYVPKPVPAMKTLKGFMVPWMSHPALDV